jgi:ubiquinone/menaquinone biosynthesis C-methylase UbiE
MSDAANYIQRLLESNPLREPVLREIIRALQLPAGSRGLDAGCGIGLPTLILADAIGLKGHVSGLDLLPELLAYGEKLAAEKGYTQRVSFHQGDVAHLPFEEDSFDWAWSADCIGYPAGELAPLLKELVRVVRPGGRVILLGWTSQQLLPGYPLLEARLNAACSSYQPYLQGIGPENHFLQALHPFREAGLEEVRAQTFAGEAQAPLEPGVRAALASLFEMLWSEPTGEAGRADWGEYRRLCRPESPDFLPDQADYYAFLTYTVFLGKVPMPHHP